MVTSSALYNRKKAYLFLVWGASLLGLFSYAGAMDDDGSLVRGTHRSLTLHRLSALSALEQSESLIPATWSLEQRRKYIEFSQSTHSLLTRVESQKHFVLTEPGDFSSSEDSLEPDRPRVLTDTQRLRQIAKMEEMLDDFFNGDLARHADEIERRYNAKKNRNGNRKRRKKFDTYGSDLDPLLWILLSEIVGISKEEQGRRPMHKPLSDLCLEAWGEAIDELEREVPHLGATAGGFSDDDIEEPIRLSDPGSVSEDGTESSPSFSATLRKSSHVLQDYISNTLRGKLDDFHEELVKEVRDELGSEEDVLSDEEELPNQYRPEEVREEEERPVDISEAENLLPKRQRVDLIPQEIQLALPECIFAPIQSNQQQLSSMLKVAIPQKYASKKSSRKHEKLLRKYRKKNARKAAKRAKKLIKIERRMQKKYRKILRRYTKKGVLNKGKLRRLMWVSTLRDSIIKLLDENK